MLARPIQPERRMSDPLASLTIGDFEPHTGETFRLMAKPELELKLVEVLPRGKTMRAGGAFSLFFVAPPGPYLPQAIYPIAHPAVGTFDIFIVPIGPLKDGNGYEAVFT
jgi:hypothetical protein